MDICEEDERRNRNAKLHREIMHGHASLRMNRETYKEYAVSSRFHRNTSFSAE